MMQLTQELKGGKMEVLEVPCPALNQGQVLVRNYYSVISAGTEGKTVSDARKGYISKARSRQEEVGKVVDLIRTQGLKSAYNLVMNKLEALSPLGYSCSGEVIAVAEDITDLKPGDFVACGGQGAYHAEIVAVYRNLCVRLPQNTDLKHAAFTTVATVALHGIRQSEVQAGGSCIVLGLGLIGQLTLQLLAASGIKAIGIDINEPRVNLALKCGAAFAFLRNNDSLEQQVLRATDGHGADAVIIAASSSSTDPVELAGTLCRHRGKVVIVGAVPTGFSRQTFYRKELDLRMSASYGPGRYDPVYEERGIDYQVGYVRWTENRNMKAFAEFLASGRLHIDMLISHVIDLEEAPKAYDLLLSGKKNIAGVLLRYAVKRETVSVIKIPSPASEPGFLSAGFIGAGNFAQNMLLPRLKGLVSFTGIATAHGNTSLYVGKKYGFSYCTSDYEKLLNDKETEIVFITTRHNLHSSQVIRSLEAGKHVFVEKPLAMNPRELEEIRDACLANGNKNVLMVGYNRRFSPFTTRMMGYFDRNQPKSINIRINAGTVPAGHWVNDTSIGGGRIIGEVCHFVDLALFIAGSPITSVCAMDIRDVSGPGDSFSALLKFMNGSTASLSYFSNGNKKVPKEFIEVFSDGMVARIDDFRKLEFFGKRSLSFKGNQDKGHTGELKAFTESVAHGKGSPIGFEELYHVSLATFAIADSIKSGRMISVDHTFEI
jgi:predicted dehydrogenase/threonine dehydrogenase-like Zn-dependent dehydrogenase